MPFGFTHYPLRSLANQALSSFFRDITVLGSENVPSDGPLIIACSHANMAIDPAVLSCTMPHARPLHYWVKDSLFANPAAGAILRNAGNIPVDRKNKNNQSLFAGTFEVMAQGECIAVFPEGTSHTSPHMLPFRDGISWAALEYVKYLAGKGDAAKGGAQEAQRVKANKAMVIPVGITYIDKAKYRSSVIVEYGKPISTEEYEVQFFSTEEGESRLAVKALTKKVSLEMMKLTINGPDWDSVVAARMSRELLWETPSTLAPENFVKASQTLVDLFSGPESAKVTSLKQILITYANLLVTSRLSNAVLSDLPLPRSLDPRRKTPLPNRVSTLWLLIRDTLSVAVRLPFFFTPMVLHVPLYLMAMWGADISKEELESQAQMKVALGLVISFLVYPVFFLLMWLCLGFTTFGFIGAGAGVYAFNLTHQAMVDENYDSAKRLLAAWRLLVGVWAPKSVTSPVDALRNLLPPTAEPYGATPEGIMWAKGITGPPANAKKVQNKRVASRRLVRHVIRTRIEAARALEIYLADLEREGGRVPARPWLAASAAFGGEVPEAHPAHAEGEDQDWTPEASRDGKEAVAYLREMGARILGDNHPEQREWLDGGATSGDDDARSGAESEG